MVPFYFGTSAKRLFGIYHAPDAQSGRDHGVVLCHSFGQEYIRGHRTFRQLATFLTRFGFHVLRFDYFGCGDSSGGSHEATVAQWTRDIETAIDELKDYGHVSQVSAVGLRLGGSLLMEVDLDHHHLQKAVLWEPVFKGSAFIQELVAQETDRLRGDAGLQLPRTGDAEDWEALGFPLTASMRLELSRLDILKPRHGVASRVLLLQNETTPDAEALADAMRRWECAVTCRHIPGPRFWLKGGLDTAQVPLPALQSIVSWLSEEEP